MLYGSIIADGNSKSLHVIETPTMLLNGYKIAHVISLSFCIYIDTYTQECEHYTGIILPLVMESQRTLINVILLWLTKCEWTYHLSSPSILRSYCRSVNFLALLPTNFTSSKCHYAPAAVIFGCVCYFENTFTFHST